MCCLITNFHHNSLAGFPTISGLLLFSSGRDCLSLVLKKSLTRSYNILYILFRNKLVEINIHYCKASCSYVDFYSNLSPVAKLLVFIHVPRQNTCLHIEKAVNTFPKGSIGNNPVSNSKQKLNQKPVSVIMLQV